jgi:tripartite-type tricarboxylate transporter receptor subunit TctC
MKPMANTLRDFILNIFHAVAAIALLACGGPAIAQNYPDHPVRIIVAFAPGGPTDVMARLLAQQLSEDLGKQFFVENQPGAGGNTGMGNAARAAPDGYTILITSSSYVVNPSLSARVSYDPYKDFIPISNVGVSPNILVANPTVPVNSVSELIAYIKANPGKISYASPGAGTTPHLSGELFRLTLGLDLVHVPFSGAGPAIQSTVAGHTPIAFVAMPPATALVKDGKLRGLAVTSKARAPALPDVPTLAEAGVKDQEADTFQGVFVPAGTPQPIVDLLQREMVTIVGRSAMRARFAELGFEPVASSSDEFAAQIRVEIAKWGKVIKDAGIKAE